MSYDEVHDPYESNSRYNDPGRPYGFLNPGLAAQAAERTRQAMQTVDELQAKRDAALAEADRYQAAIKAREAYGEKDPFKNGTLLKVEMRYPPAKTTYTYAVIKIAGRYWLTGKMQQRGGLGTGTEMNGKTLGWAWGNFVAWLAQGDATVWRTTDLEQVLL